MANGPCAPAWGVPMSPTSLSALFSATPADCSFSQSAWLVQFWQTIQNVKLTEISGVLRGHFDESRSHFEMTHVLYAYWRELDQLPALGESRAQVVCHLGCHSVEDLGSGWTGVRVQTRRSPDEMPRPGDVVVLTLGRPPQHNPLSFVTGGSDGNGRGCAPSPPPTHPSPNIVHLQVTILLL